MFTDSIISRIINSIRIELQKNRRQFDPKLKLPSIA